MKQALATKTINKANSFTGPESDGFKRYMALPRNVSLNMKIAHHLAGKPDNTFTQTVAVFLVVCRSQNIALGYWLTCKRGSNYDF